MIYDIVGCTGFVGTNLIKEKKFDGMFHSQNISQAFYRKPDLLVYAGIRAEMFLANQYPEKDLEMIKQAISNINKIAPKFIVLISTVSVYGEVADGDESTKIDKSKLTAYGRNRLYLEEWIENNYSNYLIVRLPALYGEGLKKNFIYDYIHIIPNLLKYEKYENLIRENHELGKYYDKQENGFYKCRQLNIEEKRYLIQFFKTIGFSALNFTDSRSKYQFYDLAYLWEHICLAMENKIKKINLVTEPISIAELYMYLEETAFQNEIMKEAYNYRLKTVNDNLLNGSNGYIFDKDFVKEDIKNFVCLMKRKEGLL